MNSSFSTTVARHRRTHFRHCLASGPLADQLCTSRFGEREISTTIYWGLLKQPDNQKSTTIAGSENKTLLNFCHMPPIETRRIPFFHWVRAPGAATLAVSGVCSGLGA